jgi:hypothetical protein
MIGLLESVRNQKELIENQFVIYGWSFSFESPYWL